ncbi:MAG: hypothetical protein AAGI72_00740 [Pseudomonadota bacterium]
MPCRVIAPFIYDQAIAYLMRRWKFDKQRGLATIAAELALFSSNSCEVDQLILPMPLHWRRQLERGFNQSKDLLDAMAKRHPFLFKHRPRTRDAPRLTRCRATPKQSLATREERQRNLAGAFHVRGDLAGRPVLVIDDVCTTGATAAAVTHALHAAGAGPVTLWCVARTPR